MAKDCLVCGKRLGALSQKLMIADGLICTDCYNKTGFGFSMSDFEKLSSYTGKYISDIINGVVDNPAQRTVDLEAAVTAAIVESGTSTVMQQGNIRAVASMIKDDENVIAALSASVSLGEPQGVLKANIMNRKNKSVGIVVVTNQRVVFTAAYASKAFYLTDINAIDESGYGLMGYVLRIQTASTSLVIDDIKQNMVPFRRKLDEAVHNVRNEQKNNVTMQQTVSVADEILKYKGLLDAGIITEEEFNAKKAQLLGL